MKTLLLAIVLSFLPTLALAQECPAGHTCVEDSDMEMFLRIAEEKKCLQETTPTIEASDLVITVDEDGRVFHSGTGMLPYKLHVDWCQYEIDATSQVQLQVAQQEPARWGFRFRVKAAFGFLLTDLRSVTEVADLLDGGVLLEPFYARWFNFNVYVGVRSVGAGLGVDLTQNFGLYTGYGITWQGLATGRFQQGPNVLASFAF